MKTYQPRHLKQSPTKRRPWSRQSAVAVFAAGILLLTATPAHAQTSPEVRAPSQVTIVRGDTLTGLAHRWCGSASAYKNLAAGNGIGNVDLILAGQPLKITCAATVRSTPPTTSRSNPARTPPPSGWVQPVPGARVTDCFGSRGGRHLGTDLAAPAGTPIHAVHGGTVAVVKYEAGGGGNYIVINHGGNIFSAYMHMNARSPLNVGATVQTGQTIGYVGRTGDATGNHAHFEIHNGLWHKISPASFMRSHGVTVGC